MIDSTKSTDEEITKDVVNIPDNDLAKVNNSLQALNLYTEQGLKSAELILAKIISSAKSGVTSINDGIAIMLRAQELNLPFSTCVEHIHIIKGKTGIDVHIVKTLLLRAGVTWTNTKQCAPLYEYTDGFNVFNENELPEYYEKVLSKPKEANDDKLFAWPVKYYKDFNNNTYKEYQLNSNFVVVNSKQAAQEAIKNQKIPIYRIANVPIDYITEYEFHRNINGKEITWKSSFSYIDAQTAGLFEKDTYKLYPKVLIAHRAFTLGARDQAADLLMGCYETTELKIMNGMNVTKKDLGINDAEDVEILD